MKKRQSSSNTGKGLLGSILLGIPVILIIVYLKMSADEAQETDSKIRLNEERKEQIAVPDTSLSSDAVHWGEDTITASDAIGTDRRPAMEAGDEDGYWDGWYDGAETQQRNRYDETCCYSSEQERASYAASYREGYEKGFQEALEKHKTID